MLSWKQILYFMGVGIVACVFMLVVIYRRAGSIGGAAIVAVVLGYLLSCAVFIVAARAKRSPFSRDRKPPTR